MSLRNPENPDVPKTRPSPTRFHKMLFPSNRCLRLWHGCHTLASGRQLQLTTCQKFETQTTPLGILLCNIPPSRKELQHLRERAIGRDESPCSLAPLPWMD